MRSTSMLAICLILAGPAAAQTPPSAEGAKALGEALAAYVGKIAFEKKVVTVVPEGKAYRITLAPNAAIAPFLAPGTTIDISPYSLLAAERGDGDWDVSASGPMSARFDVTVDGNRRSGRYEIAASRFSGVYSPTLGAWTSAEGDNPGISIESSDAVSRTTSNYGRMTYALTGRDVSGAVDATLTQSVASLAQTVSIPADAEAGMPGFTLDVTSGPNTSDAEMTGFEARALLDLWTFVVARAEKAEKAAFASDQEELRRRLAATLPLWKRLAVRAGVEDMTFASPYGTLALRTASFDGTADGISKSGSFTYGVDIAGLAATSPMMPAWAAGLVPSDLDLNIRIDGLDLETPARRAIAEFDLSKDRVLSDATASALAADFSDNPPRLTIDPSRLSSRDLDLTMKGEFVFTGGEPEMNLSLEAAGLDKVIAALQAKAATDPSVNEIVGALALAQGFAKALPDGRAQWIVSTKADGSVVLNGNQLVAPTAETGPAPTDENALPTVDPSPN